MKRMARFRCAHAYYTEHPYKYPVWHVGKFFIVRGILPFANQASLYSGLRSRFTLAAGVKKKRLLELKKD